MRVAKKLNRKLGIKSVLLATILFFVFSSTVAADEYSHDDFFLQFLVSGGRLNFTLTDTDGWIYSNNIRGGLELHGNLLFHLDLFSSGSLGNIQAQKSGTKLDDAEFNYYAYGGGIGLTYYFMPDNVYISYAAREGRGDQSCSKRNSPDCFKEEGSFKTKDVTLYLSEHQLAIGKEFWLSPNYAWGIALLYVTGTMRIRNELVDEAGFSYLFVDSHDYYWYGIGATFTYE